MSFVFSFGVIFYPSPHILNIDSKQRPVPFLSMPKLPVYIPQRIIPCISMISVIITCFLSIHFPNTVNWCLRVFWFNADRCHYPIQKLIDWISFKWHQAFLRLLSLNQFLNKISGFLRLNINSSPAASFLRNKNSAEPPKSFCISINIFRTYQRAALYSEPKFFT